MQVNFVRRPGNYECILDSFIEPIIRYIPQATVSPESQHGAVNVNFFVEDYHLARRGVEVFIPHGIADKGYRNGETVSKFDYVCVSGPLWRDKMIREGIQPDRIIVNGYTKMDPLFANRNPGNPNTRKKVLWAPTHCSVEGLSSYPMLEPIIKGQAFSQYTVTSSVHPANRDNHQPTMHSLALADIVIADSGSTLYEAWALGKPVVFPDWLIRDRVMDGTETFEKQIFRDNIGLHAQNEAELKEMVRYGLAKGLSDKELQFIRGIFPPELRGRSGYETAMKLKEVANR